MGAALRSQCDGALAQLEAELKQFAYARRAPERIGAAHPTDQTPNFGLRLGFPGTA